MGRLETCQRYAGRAITGHLKTTPVEAVLAEANLPTIETRGKQLCAIAMEKSLRQPLNNHRHHIATLEVKQRTTKQSWRSKARQIWGSIFKNAVPQQTPGLLPPWLKIGEHNFETTGAKTGVVETDRLETMKILEKGWQTHDATIYTDGSVTENFNGGGGIVVTTGPPNDPEVLCAQAIPAGQWCSSYQAELKAVKRALEIIQADPTINTARIVSDSLSVLLRLQNLHPSEPIPDNDERDIMMLLSEVTCRGCQLTFTWCPSHCGVIGNELADRQAKDGALKPQSEAASSYKSAKSVIRRMTRGEPPKHERTRRVYGDHGEKINRLAERDLSRKDQTTLSRLRSGHHPDLKYWLAKIHRAADTLCRKCGLFDETAEHVVYECPSIHNLLNEPTPDTLAKDPRLALLLWERWTSTPYLPEVSKPGQP